MNEPGFQWNVSQGSWGSVMVSGLVGWVENLGDEKEYICSLIFKTWSKGQPLDRMMESKGGCEFSFWATFSNINSGNGETGEV